MWLGFFLALSAQILWGFLPLYFQTVNSFTPLAISFYRIIFSCIFVFFWLLLSGKLTKAWQLIADLKTFFVLALSSILLIGNWLIYTTAIDLGRVLEGSLGYFIYPLLNVALGRIIFKDRLNRIQKIAIFLTSLSVLYLIFFYGYFPWFAFGVAITFSLYGAIRKKINCNPSRALFIETLILSPIAIVVIYYFIPAPNVLFDDWLWLFLIGPLTVISLVLFTKALAILPLHLAGMMSYTGPFLQFLMGLYLGEKLDINKLLAFVFIWVALGIYTFGTVKFAHHKQS